MEFKDLAAQLQEGHLDSVGKFSLDSTRSESQFANQVALQPHLFLGRLLQAANVADAVQIRYAIERDEMFVQIVPHNLSPFLAMADFIAGLKPPENSVQQYLQEAFGCARALKPSRLLFHVVGPQASYCVNLLDGSIDRIQKPNPVQGLLLEFATPPRRWRFIDRWLSKSSPQSPTVKCYLADNFRTPESFVLAKCCFSAVPVFLNGKHIRFRPSPPSGMGQSPDVLEAPLCSSSQLELVHMQLIDRNLPKSCWINGPSPSSLQSNRAVINHQIFGTAEADANYSGGTWTLSLVIPCSDNGVHDGNVAWRVSRMYRGGATWMEGERASKFPLLCGQWKGTSAHSGEKLYEMERLDFLELHNCFLRKSPVPRDQDQLCCACFVSVLGTFATQCFVPVKDGLALSAESPPSWNYRSFVVAVVPGLKVDLNGTRVIKDGVYDKIVSHYRACVAQLQVHGRRADGPPKFIAPTKTPD